MNWERFFEQWIHGYLLTAGSLSSVITALLFVKVAPPWFTGTPWLLAGAVFLLFGLGCLPSIAWQQACQITKAAS